MIHDFMKTIISAIKSWVSNEIKDASKANIADWNQSDIEASNYIKNRTHWEEKNLEVIVNKTSLNFSGCSSPAWGRKKDGYLYVPIPLTLIPKQTYEVIFDDIIYPCIAFYDNIYNNVVIGNEALVNSTGDDNNVPFAIGNYEEGLEYAYVIALDQNQHTFTIAQTSTTIHKLDSKFLSDDIKSDWNETDETSKSFILNKPNIMDKENPSGIGSFSINRVNGSMIGNNSCAIGNEVIACGENSIASGFNVIATKPNQYAIGKYNIFENIYIEKNSKNASFNAPIKNTKTYQVASNYEFSPFTGIFSLIAPFTTKITQSRYTNYYLFEDGGTSGTIMYKLDSVYSSTDNSRAAYTYTSEPAIDDGNLLIVGNGTVNDARSNAHTLDWEGNAWFAGDVYVGSTSGINKDEGSKKLVTEEYVQTEITNSKQSDWDQNDETAPDYIKNKPFFDIKEETIVYDYNIVFAQGEDQAGVHQPIEIPTGGYENDDVLVVLWNDNEFRYTNLDSRETSPGSWAYELGNLNIYRSDEEITEEPFYLRLDYEYGVNVRRADTSSDEEIHLVIKRIQGEMKQIDEKYIPDTIARVSDVEAMIDKVKTINLDNYYLQITEDDRYLSYTEILSELILNNINQNITTTSIEISQDGNLFKDITNDPSPQLNNLAMTWVDDAFVVINNIAIIKDNNEVTTISFNVSLFETNIQKFINIHAAISINQIDIAVNVL